MSYRRIFFVALSCATLFAQGLLADVKVERKTKMEFPGILGGIVKVFGGKAARDGVVSKVAVKGDRKMTLNDDTSELVDLAQEKIYRIDMKGKSYTVVTFEEMRRQMQEALAKAKAQAGEAPKDGQKTQEKPAEKPPEFTVDVSIKESGQKKKVNGFDSREVVTTITVREKNKKAEDGSMVMTSSMWLAPRIAAMKELEDFDRRYAQKLLLPFAADMAQQMTPAMGMYPGLKEAMGKLELEKVNMDGTAVLTVIKAEGVGNPNQSESGQNSKAESNNKQNEIPKSLGGLLGGLGRKAAKKDDNSNADNNKPGSATFMTINEELVSVATTVAESDISIPAGFKEKK
jgi:hypothetical protein